VWNSCHGPLWSKMPSMSKTMEGFGKIMESAASAGGASKEDAEQMQHMMNDTVLAKVHENECDFYTLNPRPNVPMPKCYLAQKFSADFKEPGLLVLEDLSGNGMTPSLFEGLRLGQLEPLFLALAKLHAYSIMNPNWSAGGEKFKMPFDKSGFKFFEQMLKGSAESFRATYPDIFNISDENLHKLVPTEADLESFFDIGPKKFVSVMCHGDFWNNNMLFKKGANGKSTDQLLALIDWQITFGGSCIHDMSRILITGADSDVRRNYKDYLFQLYYSHLKAILPKDIKIPYTLADMSKLYEEAFKFGVIGNFMQSQIILTNPQLPVSIEDKRRLVTRLQGCIEDAVKTIN